MTREVSCSSCGWPYIHDAYHNGVDCAFGKAEHIHRVCTQCHNEWAEQPQRLERPLPGDVKL